MNITALDLVVPSEPVIHSGISAGAVGLIAAIVVVLAAAVVILIRKKKK